MKEIPWKAVSLAVLKLLALLVGYIVVLVVLSLFWVMSAGIENYSASLDAAMEPLQILGGVVYTLCVMWFYRRKKFPFRESAGLTSSKLSKPELAMFAAYGVLLNLFFVMLLNLLPAAKTTAYGISVSEALLGGDFGLACVIILFYAPFTEELFFRGLAFTYLRGCMKPYQAAILLSFVFGLNHNQPLWALYAMLMGMVFSAMTIRTGSIIPSMITHFCFNATSLALFATSVSLRADWPFGLHIAAVWLLFAVIAALSVFMTMKLYDLTGRNDAHVA
jgi:membrane protease YdiL (CAAX protease family)